MASDSNSPKAHRREGCLATAQIKPVIVALFRCTSSELFFSCLTPAPGRAAGGRRLDFAPQAQAA